MTTFAAGRSCLTKRKIPADLIASAKPPVSADWSAASTIISQGSAGQWDHYFGGTPVIVTVFRRPSNGDLVALYVGAEDSHGSAGPAMRALGAAISRDDGVTWTKHAGNPVLTYLPNAGGYEGDEGIWAAAAYVHTDGQIYMIVGGLEDDGGSGSVRGNLLRTVCSSGDGVTWAAMTEIVDGEDDTWYTGSTDNERFPLALWHDASIWHMLYGYKKAGGWDIAHAWTGSDDFTDWSAGDTEAFLLGSAGTLEQARQIAVVDRGLPNLRDYWLLSRTNANPGDVDICVGALDFTDPSPPSTPPILHLDPSGSADRTYGLPVYLDKRAAKWFCFTNDGNIDEAQKMRTQTATALTAPAWPAMVDFKDANAERYYVSASTITLPLPMAIGVLTNVGDNTGSNFQYLFDSADAGGAGVPVQLFLREASASTPNAWVAGFQGSTAQITSSSTPGGDSANRLIVMQGSSAARQLWFCTGGGSAASQGSSATAVPSQQASSIYFGARTDLNTDRFYEEQAAWLFIAKRFLLEAEMEAIAAGYSLLDVLGADVLQDAWLFTSADASVANLISGRPAMTRNGTGW